MKVIDLLVKIVNGEEVPKTIKVYGHKYQYAKDMKDYKAEDIEKYWLISNFIEDYLDLKEEVEVIEDTPKEDKKLEKLDVVLLGQCDNWLQPTIDTDEKIRAELNPYLIDVIRENTLDIQHKINEIIDKINKE